MQRLHGIRFRILGKDVCSGRAILSLRESYRSDLKSVKQITDFSYIRFHAIFHDEVGVYSEDDKGGQSTTSPM